MENRNYLLTLRKKYPGFGSRLLCPLFQSLSLSLSSFNSALFTERESVYLALRDYHTLSIEHGLVMRNYSPAKTRARTLPTFNS